MRFSFLQVLVLAVPSLGLGEAFAQVESRATEPTFLAPCGTEAEFWQTLRETHGVMARDVPFRFLRIFAQGDSFHLELEALDGSQRSLADPSCRTLFETALVIAAAAARSGDVAAAPVPPPPPPAPAEVDIVAAAVVAPMPPPEPPIELTLPSERPGPGTEAGLVPEKARPVPPPRRPNDRQTREPAASRSSSRFWPMLFAGGGVSFAFAPAPAGFGELGVGLRYGDAAVTLLGRYYPPTENQTQGTVGLRMESGGGRLAFGYFVRPWLRLELGPSATLLEGTALGIARPGSASLWMAAGELEALAAPWRVHGFGVELGARGWVTLNSPRFEMDSGDEVFQVPRAGAAIFLRGTWQSR
jgi:hypothetical protein